MRAGTRAAAFPFSAIEEHALARRCLLALAVDPLLRGAVILSSEGTTSSSLRRSFESLLSGEEPATPVFRVPIAVDRDRLTGGLDLDRTLATGHAQRSVGLLDRARGGFLVLDGLERTDPWILSIVRHATLDDPEGTRWLASAEAGTVLAPAADAVAFLVPLEPERTSSGRARILERFFAYELDPVAFARTWEDAEFALRASMAAARSRLAEVRLPDESLRLLVAEAVCLGVEGARAEVFAARAARVNAALRGASSVAGEDLEFAVRSVLSGRARAPSAATPARGVSEPPSSQESPGPARSGARDAAARAEMGASPSTAPSPAPRDEEALLAAHGPPDAGLESPEGFRPGSTAEEHFASFAAIRRSGIPGLSALGARAPSEHAGRSAAAASQVRGHARRSRIGFVQGSRLAIGATLRRAALAMVARPPRPPLRIVVTKDDLCRRELRVRGGALHVLVVDASGSMAAERIREAKTLALGLLAQAYVHRDAVALVAVRGDAATLILPPTSALARARRAIEILPAGGGTPLADAVVLVARIAANERRRHNRPITVVFFTDGRANVSRQRADRSRRPRDAAAAELEALAPAFRRLQIPTVVVASGMAPVGKDDARRFAELLGARHFRPAQE